MRIESWNNSLFLSRKFHQGLTILDGFALKQKAGERFGIYKLESISGVSLCFDTRNDERNEVLSIMSCIFA